MKIDSSRAELAVSHASWQRFEQRESARATPPARRADAAAPPRPTRATISDAGQAAASDPVRAGQDAIEQDPRWQLLVTMLRLMFGEDMERWIKRPREAAASGGDAPPAGAPEPTQEPTQEPTPDAGPQRSVEQTRIEFEFTSFQAGGLVRTADGREIRFDLQLQLSHLEVSWTREHQQAAQDPLVLNFDGLASQLLDARFEFDLDGDGQAENVPRLGGGSAWLAFDRNHDGTINDGSELFGPRTSNGFGELAALDADGNGWIDENDPAWADLRVWRPGSEVQTLAEADVGALHVASVEAPFTLRGDQGLHLGQMRRAGFYLHEDGRPGGLQQLDLNV